MTDPETPNPYLTLGIPPEATREEIRLAWQRASAKAHPDRSGGDSRRQQQINDAFALLSDAERRAEYDATGRSKKPDLSQRARQMLMNFLGQVDLAIDDPLPQMHEALHALRAQVMVDRAARRHQVQRLDKRRRALKVPCGPNLAFLIDYLEIQTRAAEGGVLKAEEMLECLDLAQQFLQGYTCAGDTLEINRYLGARPMWRP
jgi:curved DNA-binding protein CbpA